MIDTTSVHAGAAYAQARIHGIGAAPPDTPTPCADWPLRSLVDHLVAVVDRTARGLSGEKVAGLETDPALAPSAPWPAGDAFAEAAERLRRAAADPAAWNTVVDAPFPGTPGDVALSLALTDMLVHGWDIARATGQDEEMPEAVAGQVLEFTRLALPGDARAGYFDPEVQVGPEATNTRQLVAFLGRRP